MQRHNQQTLKADISKCRPKSLQSKKYPPRSSSVSQAKASKVIELYDDTFSHLLLDDEVLIEELKAGMEKLNFSQILDGEFPDQPHLNPDKVLMIKPKKPKNPNDQGKNGRILRKLQSDETGLPSNRTRQKGVSRLKPAVPKSKNGVKLAGHKKNFAGKTPRISPAKLRQSKEKKGTSAGQGNNLADQTLILADQTLSIAASMFRSPKKRETEQPAQTTKRDKPVTGRADQKTSLADRTMGVVTSMFKPVKSVRLDENQDVYFGKERRIEVDYSVLHAAPATKLSMLVFFAFVGVALSFGWYLRGEELLSAERGLGYMLGIIGGAMMLMLVFYPLRKKFSSSKYLGPVKLWFYIHMIFGTLGPALILFHANFSVGSLNSQVALAFTLLVASSGFFHMYIYTRVHYRLHGKKMTLQELQEKTEANRTSLQYIFAYAPKLKTRLQNFEEEVLSPPHSVIASVLRLWTIGFRTRLNYLIIMRGLKRGLKIVFERADWPLSELEGQYRANKQIIKEHMKAILKIVELSFYERLFGQWYLFHGPLFFMLVFVGIIHVIAVHMY